MIRDPPRSTLFPYTTLSQSFEVGPGGAAGIAAPAYAGIPVTHRGLAGGVAFVTGFTQETELDLADLARFPGTLVFYMGVKTLPRIAEALMAGGRPAHEPAAKSEEHTDESQATPNLEH